MSDLLGRDGALAKARPGWEPREAQEKMVGAVWEALGRGDNLVVEAGTGIGKSLAYLLPAALWAVKNGCRAVRSEYEAAAALADSPLTPGLPGPSSLARRLAGI